MSSILGTVGLPNQVAYASSKGGVDQMTKVMALEWAKQGVRVNAIGPTYFETELVTQIRNDSERFKFINERTPMGRWGYLPELEGAVIFLASPASDFVTGQTIYVDGGWTIWRTDVGTMVYIPANHTDICSVRTMKFSRTARLIVTKRLRIFLITWSSSMHAFTCIAPLHLGQIKRKMSNEIISDKKKACQSSFAKEAS